MPNKLEIETAHAAGDTESFDRWTAEAIGIDATHSHSDPITMRGCQYKCGVHVRYHRTIYCTRYTTDPTSVVEFRKSCWPDNDYKWLIDSDGGVTAESAFYITPCVHRIFNSGNESFDMCAAVHWARADAEERATK